MDGRRLGRYGIAAQKNIFKYAYSAKQQLLMLSLLCYAFKFINYFTSVCAIVSFCTTGKDEFLVYKVAGPLWKQLPAGFLNLLHNP